jgi:hypothetical protein
VKFTPVAFIGPGSAIFNPIGERGQQIELIGRRSAGAVAHVRDRVEARELLRPFQAAEPLGHLFIVLDRVENWLARIAEAMKADDLVSIINEASDISRGGVGHNRGIRVEQSQIGIEVETGLTVQKSWSTSSVTRVALPPGRLKTIGIVEVTALAARAAGVLDRIAITCT